MSAIALPLVYSDTVTNPIAGTKSQPVNADHIMGIAKLDAPEVPNSSRTPRNAIVITVLSTEDQIKSVIWEYADEATRNTALDDLYTAVAAVI